MGTTWLIAGAAYTLYDPGNDHLEFHNVTEKLGVRGFGSLR